MKKKCVRAEPLFSVPERMGLATLVLLFFVFGILCLESLADHAPPQPGSWAAVILKLWDQFFGSWVDSGLTELAWTGISLWFWIDTFRRLRFRPLTVTRSLAWLAGIVLVLFVPSALVKYFQAGLIDWAYGPWWYFASNELNGLFLVLAIVLILVVFAGELSQAARERMLPAEWRAVCGMPDAEQERWRRREALVLAIRGPRMPAARGVNVALALALCPSLAAIGVTQLAEEIGPLERRIVAPKIVPRVMKRHQSEENRLRIDNAGRVYLGRALAAATEDRTGENLLFLIKKSASARTGADFLLEIDPEVRFERIIDVLSAADRAGVRVAIED